MFDAQIVRKYQNCIKHKTFQQKLKIPHNYLVVHKYQNCIKHKITQCVRFSVIYHVDAQVVHKYQNYIKHKTFQQKLKIPHNYLIVHK